MPMALSILFSYRMCVLCLDFAFASVIVIVYLCFVRWYLYQCVVVADRACELFGTA